MRTFAGTLPHHLLSLAILGMVLAGCTAADETTQTPAVESTPLPSPKTTPADEEPVAPTATVTIELSPTATPTPEPSPTPTPAAVEPSPTPLPAASRVVSAELPMVNELDFRVADQFGGVSRALAVEGTTAYVGFGPRLLTLNVSDPANPQLLGQSQPLPDLVQGVDVDGGLVYLAAGPGGLIVLDASDPADIQIVNAGTNYPGEGQPAAEEIAVVGGIAYVVDHDRVEGSSSLLRFDVSDPTVASLLDSLALKADESVTVAGDLIVVVGSGRLLLRDGANPDHILSQRSLAGGSFANRAAVHDELVTVGESGGPTSGIEQFDVGDPANPALVSLFTQPDGLQDAQGLAMHENMAYVLTAEGRGFDVVTLDLSRLGSDLLANRLRVGQEPLLDLFFGGNTLIAPVWMGGLNTLDISDPAAPQILRRPAEDELYAGDLFSVVVGDDVLYTTVAGDYLAGVGAIDLSDPADPILAAVAEIGNATGLSLALSEDMLYVLSQGDRNQVHVYDVSQRLEPRETGVVTLVEAPQRLAVVGSTLYAACDGWNCQSLYGIDVSDPSHPAVTHRWELPFGVRDMVTDEESGTIYLQTSDAGIWALEAADPETLRLAGHLQLPGGFARLEVVGNRIYAGAYDAGLYVVDVIR